MPINEIVSIVGGITGIGALIVSLRKVQVDDRGGIVAGLTELNEGLQAELKRARDELREARDEMQKTRRECSTEVEELKQQHQREIASLQQQINTQQQTIIQQANKIRVLEQGTGA